MQSPNLFKILIILLAVASQWGCTAKQTAEFPDGLDINIALAEPGNPSELFTLEPKVDGNRYLLSAVRTIPVEVTASVEKISVQVQRITFSVHAREAVSFHLAGSLAVDGTSWEQAYFLLPGFWYRKNLRSPENTPSARISKEWMVREDRLSSPLAGVFNRGTGDCVSLYRADEIAADVLMPYKKGEIFLHGDADVGSLGFGETSGEAFLSFGYPFAEYPKTYIRKLTLDPPVTAFLQLEKGESSTITYEIRKWKSETYSEFVETNWNYSFDKFQPQPIAVERSDEDIKEVLSDYFRQSYTDEFQLKGFSGVHLLTAVCEKRGILEVGFVGRVLLNAYNALVHGYETGDDTLVNMAREVFGSYERYGYTENGFIREVVDFRENRETDVYSIRRQSEGLFALLQYLDLEREQGRTHTAMEQQVKRLLDKIVTLQHVDKFPRKFMDNMSVVDSAGGSSSTAVIPLLMGWKYFGDETYLEVARNTGKYIEREIISKGDYFSSTLDANCEDKEASLYAASAMYYLGLTEKDENAASHYFHLAETASYFALSWYYLWDVPFAPGQLLGELGFKTRGWGNVSVENNHVDVYIFDFTDVLNHLAEMHGNRRLAEMAGVIGTSMKEQLLPVEGRMCGIAKTGYYPEVVQHTNWDYGQFGKGYYNDLFAPGWTVASLWELLSVNRLHEFFE